MTIDCLAVCGHKGGTGRTTAALALAWCWAQAGRAVTLIDADPLGAASLVALPPGGSECPWPNVTFRRGMPPEGPPAGGVTVIDCPSLGDPEAGRILRRCRGVLVCAAADPVAVRTLPTAAGVVRAARAENPRLELLGILVGMYDNHDPVQQAILAQLRQRHGELLLEPPVPLQAEVRDWPAAPGSEPPAGPAIDAYATIARGLEHWLLGGSVVG